MRFWLVFCSRACRRVAKEAYLWADPLPGKSSGEVHLRPAEKDESRPTQKIWSLIKPLISAYVGREVYNRVKGPTKRQPTEAELS